jgi:hypothetical protein
MTFSNAKHFTEILRASSQVSFKGYGEYYDNGTYRNITGHEKKYSKIYNPGRGGKRGQTLEVI